MGFELDIFEDWAVYVPDIGDNRLDVKFTVEIKPMTTAETKAFQRRYGPRLQGKQAISRAQKMTSEIVQKRTRNIDGLTARNHDTGEVTDIYTGEELLKFAPSELVEDLFSAISNASHLKEGLKKNLSSPSDSLPVETPRSSGTAKPVREKAASKGSNPVDKPYNSSETVKVTPIPTSPGDLLQV